LAVTDANDVALETFADLSMVTTDKRYAPAAINETSALIRVETATPTALPDDGTVPLDAVTEGHVGTLLAPEAPGGAGAKFRSALLALFAAGGLADRIDLFNIICVPGLVDAATIDRLQQCARGRRALLLVDCDEAATAGDVIASLAGKTGANADHAAFYFPWVKAPDPLQNGVLTPFPPCGFVAGLLARTDRDRGVWKAPAGADASLIGATGLTVQLNDTENDRLNRAGINCLRTLPIHGIVAWGARTMAGNDSRASERKYIPVRRTALYLEESLYRGTGWVVFEPNDEPLWARIRLSVGAFMQGLFRQGALQGSTPKDAWFVKCDGTTTTQNDIDNGIVNILVGFAPLKPAEFVIISIRQMAGRSQA
jgi:phage tail sheath protein FI